MAHRSRLGGICIDCQTDDPKSPARFWAEVFGAGVVRDGGKYNKLEDQSGLSCDMLAVEHPPRVHIGIETDEMAKERRLIALGAARMQAIGNWVVMEGPTGYRFCIVPTNDPDFGQSAREWK